MHFCGKFVELMPSGVIHCLLFINCYIDSDNPFSRIHLKIYLMREPSTKREYMMGLNEMSTPPLFCVL